MTTNQTTKLTSDRISIDEVDGVVCLTKTLNFSEHLREVDGYKQVAKYYPVPKLINHKSNQENDIGTLTFQYEPSIGENRGLLVDLFADNEAITPDFSPILKMYRSAFGRSLTEDPGKAANIFFSDRINTRLQDYYQESFLAGFDGAEINLNGHHTRLQLRQIITKIKKYFESDRTYWCVVSQCDPNDLNIGTKPILFDYTAGGLVPLMAEFATLFWYNLAQGDHLALSYNKSAFTQHQLIYQKQNQPTQLTNNSLVYRLRPIRKKFIEAYITEVLRPTMSGTKDYGHWYQDFFFHFSMKILAVVDLSQATREDQLLSFGYLQLFFDQLELIKDLDQLIALL